MKTIAALIALVIALAAPSAAQDAPRRGLQAGEFYAVVDDGGNTYVSFQFPDLPSWFDQGQIVPRKHAFNASRYIIGGVIFSDLTEAKGVFWDARNQGYSVELVRIRFGSGSAVETVEGYGPSDHPADPRPRPR